MPPGPPGSHTIQLTLEMGHKSRLKDHVKDGYVKKYDTEATHDWEFFIRDKASQGFSKLVPVKDNRVFPVNFTIRAPCEMSFDARKIRWKQ